METLPPPIPTPEKYLFAAAVGNEEVVKAALKHIDPTFQDWSGIVINKIRDLDDAVFFGMNALQLACYKRQTRIVTLLLQDENGRKTLNQQDRGKRTALHLLAFDTDCYALELIKKLAKAGAEINIKDQWGKTPLDIALSEQNLAAVQFLLSLHPKKSMEHAHKHCQLLEFRSLPIPSMKQLKESPDPVLFNPTVVLDGLGIACEAPRERQQSKFWKMILDKDIDTIIQLTNNDHHIAPYVGGKFGEFNVKRIEGDVIDGLFKLQMLFKQTIEINHGEKTKKVTHYFAMNWPDGGVVPPTFLANLVKVIADEMQKGNIKKLLTHCIAGIGRTGTFYATLKSYLDHVKGDTSYNLVYRNATQLRKDRPFSIQTEEQYCLVHKTFELLKGDAAKKDDEQLKLEGTKESKEEKKLLDA